MDNSLISRDVIAADEARYQALYAQDVDLLASMLCDDYLHTHANGKIDTKSAFLESIKASRYRFIRADRQDQQVRIVEPFAFLTGLTSTTIEVGAEIKTLNNAFVTAWLRQEGGWRLFHWQATKAVVA